MGKRLKAKGISDARLLELRGFCMQYGEFCHRRPEFAEMIDQAAIAADADIYPFLIRHVSGRVGYAALRDVFGMPAGADKFYSARRRFFIILDKRRDGSCCPS
jgi:hypothetical protein